MGIFNRRSILYHRADTHGTTTLTAPRILVIFVVFGVILQAVGLYEPIADFAKTGATVPLPGFGYSLAKGAMEGSA